MPVMRIYKVGGAVRDSQLSLPIKDTDWVVTGASVDNMLSAGFRQVGRDFPVFLHPDTGEEYALARTERKSGHGYTGFSVHADPSVTLEEDLLRRDLTINAMAEDRDGRLIDPYNGQQDIKAKVLRHVSPAFAEDPLRVLRVARFAARFADLGFRIADETMSLMKTLTAAGELSHLVAERVWQETARALTEKRPDVYFLTLRECGALAELFPEIDSLFACERSSLSLPATNAGKHSLKALKAAALVSGELDVRFAALVHCIGPEASAENEDVAANESLASMCSRLKVPNDCAGLAGLAVAYMGHCHGLASFPADDGQERLLSLLENCDALRKPQRFLKFLQVCEAEFRSWPGQPNTAYPQSRLCEQALASVSSVSTRPLIARGLSGPALGAALRAARLESLAALSL